MKILFLTFYFEPDLCAGSFRNTPLAKELAEQLSNGELHVVTTMPNRYSSFESSASENETIGNIQINRISIPQHKGGFIDQIKSFKTFFFGTLNLTNNQEYDLVYASSSRLFTALLGRYISRKKKLPLYLDIRDIFTDTLKDVIKSNIFRICLLPVLKLLERYTFGKTEHINLVSQGFKQYFTKYRKPIYTYYTNGIDSVFLEEIKILKQPSAKKTPLTITYAGNIGEGQGLEKIIPKLAKILVQYEFIIIGDGGTRHLLESEISENDICNVRIIPPMPREKLMKYYKNADFLFFHLNDYEAFKKVLPSKVFEYAAYPVPIIAGVGGYADEFVRENVKNSILFSPGNAAEAAQKILENDYYRVERSNFINSFSRRKIMKKMAKSIIAQTN